MSAYTEHGKAADARAEKLIADEVLWNQSYLVDSILAADDLSACRAGQIGGHHEPLLFGWDDISGLLPVPEDMSIGELIAWCEDMGHGDESKELIEAEAMDEDELRDELETIVNDNAEPAEVYEWWLVSSWLSGQLENAGEVTLDSCGCHWWGRCTTGQAILLDGVMQDIICRLGWVESDAAAKDGEG